MEKRLWHWLKCEGRTRSLQREEEYFVELPPEDYQADCCNTALFDTRDAAQKWEEELASTLSDLKLTRRSACPYVWQGRIKSEHVATLHGVDNRRRTVGGGNTHQKDIEKIRDQEASD